MSRLIAGGLCGVAVILALLGSPLWIPHAVAGVIATVAAVLSDRIRLLSLVPAAALIVVFFVAWW